MDPRDKRAREIQEAIGAVLLRDWDPIGAQDWPEAQDEYNSYIGGVYRLLATGASVEEIAAHLARIELEWIGHAAPSESRDLAAARLKALDVRLGEP